MNANRQPVVIDQSRVADGLLFATHGDRCRYLGKSRIEKLRWLKENAGKWRSLAEVGQDAARLMPPVESKTNPGAGPVGPIGQASTHDVRRDGDAEDDVGGAPGGACSSSHEPTSLPTPVTAIIKKRTTKAEPPLRAKPAMSETMGPKDEISPLGAPRGKQGRVGGRRFARAGRMRTLERMRIVIDSLKENPTLYLAASKAGIHRKTLTYWLKRSAAGDAGYDIEEQGHVWRFHELCESAMQEAHDKVRLAAWDIAMGADLKDEDGKPIPKSTRRQKGKMLRFLLESWRPDKWGKHRKIGVPHNNGALVVGGIPKKVNKGAAASVKARKWKAARRMVQETKV